MIGRSVDVLEATHDRRRRWWHDPEYEPGVIAHARVDGHDLTIHQDGHATLDVDGVRVEFEDTDDALDFADYHQMFAE